MAEAPFRNIVDPEDDRRWDIEDAKRSKEEARKKLQAKLDQQTEWPDPDVPQPAAAILSPDEDEAFKTAYRQWSVERTGKEPRPEDFLTEADQGELVGK